MRKLFFILIAAVFSLAAIGRTVKLEYGEFDDDLKQLAEFENIDLLKIRLISDTAGGEYDLVAVTIFPDSVHEQLISTFMPIELRKDTTEWNVFAKPLSPDSVRIGIKRTNYQPIVHHVPTKMSILFNYLSQREFHDTEEIPLFVYSEGKKHDIEWDGQIVKAYQYCEVRECGKHPSEWGKAFDLPTYVYYVLRPKISNNQQ